MANATRLPLAASIALLALAAAPTAANVQTFARFEGTVGAEVAAFGTTSLPGTRGTLTLRFIPQDATILFAALYSTDWVAASARPVATFDGHVLPAAAAFDSSPSGHRAFRWDVTPFVRGSGMYPASAEPFFAPKGLALVVVYSHPSLPIRSIVVNDGVTAIGTGHTHGLGETPFERVGAGFGEAWIYVTGDDGGASGETIRLNGANVGGPLDSSLRGNSSLVWVAGMTRLGRNTLEIETFGDWLNLNVAVLVAPPPCDAGNVNGAAGPVIDVLFVNDSTGGPDRTVELLPNEPLSVFIAAPPSASAPAPFALFGWSGLPNRPTELPAGLGASCMPMPLSGGDPRLKVIWNNIGRRKYLGTPTAPSMPAPHVVYTDADGVGRTARFFLQGLILDSASPSGRAAVTNGVTVIVR